MDKAFIEFGSGRRAELTFLLADNWKQQATGVYAPLVDVADDWFGVFVEPYPASLMELIGRLEHICPDRERYMVVSGAITAFPGFFSLFPGEYTNIHKPDHAASLIDLTGHHPPYFNLFSFSLDMLIKKIPYPVELLRADCEGFELGIFNQFSFQPKPKLIIVEPHPRFDPDIEEKLTQIFVGEGYALNKTADKAGEYLNYLIC